jgi:L-amino acid N-acyltransferase YncA
VDAPRGCVRPSVQVIPAVWTIEAMTLGDWNAVRNIYEEGLATRHATFETTAPTWEEWHARHHPFGRLVARSDKGISGWAALSPVAARNVYAGVAEVSIYVAAAQRGHGIGNALMSALIAASEQAGVWTLQASIFPENVASVALHVKYGFRIVGKRERIGRLDGVWRDTLLLERRSGVAGA